MFLYNIVLGFIRESNKQTLVINLNVTNIRINLLNITSISKYSI